MTTEYQATQYDSIAESYSKLITDFPVRELVEFNLWRVIGDVSGKSVLDLACGEGLYTRNFKNRGAARVVGVDVSEELIKLARQREEQEGLSIEYIVGDGRTLDKIGEFDLVTSAFMLNYAPTNDDLLQMCRVVHSNLGGGRFVAINTALHNCLPCRDGREYQKYGFDFRFDVDTPEDGAVFHVTIGFGSVSVNFDAFYYSAETYERSLKAAGFQSVKWHKPILPPRFDTPDVKAFWQHYLNTPTQMILECSK